MSTESMHDGIDCIIYRSRLKDGMYLYLRADMPYDEVPEPLRQRMGREPEEAMRLTLSPQRKLAREDVATVMTNLRERGFHLQMPPTDEYLASWDNEKMGLRARKQAD
ncbi:MAG TPA: YcgL domain-containing protein [Chromatiales bacterium]|nr:YcgL domain-containing protein [Chromatiales bacterium]